MNGEALIERRLREWGERRWPRERVEITELERSGASVTWDLRQRGERCGYVRLDLETNLLHVRVIYAQEQWSDARARELDQLPKPLFGRLDVRRVRENLVCRLMVTCEAEAPRRLEAALTHFLLVRSARVDGVLDGNDAIEDLKSTLQDALLPVPAVARELPGLAKLGPWRWGTRFVPLFAKEEDLGVYEQQPIEEAILTVWDRQPFFAMSQQVHGMNTYLNLACSVGPVAVIADLQVNPFADEPGNELYQSRARTQVARLIALVDDLPKDLSADPSVLLFYSEYSLHSRLWHLNGHFPTADDGGPVADLEETFAWAREEVD